MFVRNFVLLRDDGRVISERDFDSKLAPLHSSNRSQVLPDGELTGRGGSRNDQLEPSILFASQRTTTLPLFRTQNPPASPQLCSGYATIAVQLATASRFE